MTDVAEKFKNIKILFFDLDGTLLNEGDDENLFVKSLSDFCREVESFGMSIALITVRDDDDLTNKIKTDCGCEIITASFDKVSAAEKILNQHGFTFDQAFFMGDGILDIPLLNRVGLKAAPYNARREVKRKIDFVSAGITGENILAEVLKLIALSGSQRD